MICAGALAWLSRNRSTNSASTLNRLELSRAEATRYHKISHDPAAIDLPANGAQSDRFAASLPPALPTPDLTTLRQRPLVTNDGLHRSASAVTA